MVQPHSILDIPDEGTTLEPVEGGSGNLYLSIAAAIAGELAIPSQVDRITGQVPQAGTVAGSLVGPGTLSAVNDFYKDYYVINTDTTPTNGLVSQWARVSSYVGATRTLILDKPWDFAAESDFALVKVIRIGLLKDVAEDVSSAVGFELNLAGHKLTGKIDLTAEEFHWIRGAGGYVTNGVEKSAFGLLKVDDCTVSRRDATIYALLMTNGSDLGRTELDNCRFMGRVAGRRGRSGWAIVDCTNLGVPNATGDDDVPYALTESVGAITIALTQLDAFLDTEFGGAPIYSENSITGGTVYLSVTGIVKLTSDYDPSQDWTPKKYSIAKCVGAGIVDVTTSAGHYGVTHIGYRSANTTSPSVNIAVASFLSVKGCSSVSQLILNGSTFVETDYLGSILLNAFYVEGPADTTGTFTLGGTSTKAISGESMRFKFLEFNGRFTGTLAISGAAFLIHGNSNAGFTDIDVAQNLGAPSITVSAALDVQDSKQSVLNGTALVSVGTWVFSGDVKFKATGIGIVYGLVSTGTAAWTFSGALTVQANFDGVTAGLSDTLVLGRHNGAGTLVISGAVFIQGGRFLALSLAQATSTTTTVTISSATIRLSNLNFGFTAFGTATLVVAATASSIASVSGTVIFSNCVMEAGQTLISSTPGGASATGPIGVVFEFCAFEGALTDSTGAGTILWTAGATITFRHCHVEGLFTFVGTPFTTIQAFHTRFNGNSGNNCITGSGSRPTTYRLWKCSYNAIINGLKPEVIEDYAVVPANAALTRGNLMSINSSANAIAALATSVVEGVLLAAAAGANNPALLVRRGKIFVSSDAAVVAGDSCVLDVVTTPTNQIKGAALTGQRTARALEATGATIANLAYSEVNLM